MSRNRPPVIAALALAALAAFALVPLAAGNPYVLHVFILFFISTALAQGWNVLGGYAGQYSIGHAAFYGLGAYATLLLLQKAELAPTLGIWAGMGLAVAAALVVGSICFRLRGTYFVLASIAVLEILRIMAINMESVTNGAQGVQVIDVPPLRLGATVITDFSTKVPYYYFGLGLSALSLGMSAWVHHSKLGYCLQAIREDEDAASSLGIHLSAYKNAALAISAAFAALVGGFAALYVGYIDPGTTFSLDLSIEIVLTCIIGGVGTILGPVIGAVVLVTLSELLRANVLGQAVFGTGLVSPESAVGKLVGEQLAHAHVLIYGLLVVIVILFMPQGIHGFVSGLWARRAAHAGKART